MIWFVASLGDEDTHFGETATDGTVTARCGRLFRPLVALVGVPPDPLQTCPICAQSQQDNPLRQ